MDIIPKEGEHLVHQRNEATGCIPWSYEVILRHLGVRDIDYGTFQEDFDLGRDDNHFGSVSDAIKDKYQNSDAEFTFRTFEKGEDKLAFMRILAARTIPFAISLPNKAFDSDAIGWHICPVLRVRDDDIGILWEVDEDGNPKLIKLTNAEVTGVHDQHGGGKEVAYPANREAELPPR
jgi:hypothetical protein